MNKIDLKNKLKDYYLNCLKSNDLNLLIGLDAVKSLMGIDLSLSNNTLIEWFMNYSHKSTSYSAEYLKFKEYKNVPEAISVHSLESCLLAKDIKRARENLFYLSRVSDGIQILEFMLEFSLRYCTDVYKHIWHIMRMQKFLDCEFIVESLNKCVDLIMKDEFIENKKVISNDSNVKWSTYLLLDEIKPNDLFLYYTIYHSKLIRREMINSLILCRLENIDKKKNKNLDKFINIKDSQILEGRKWILNYLNSLDQNEINYDDIVLFDNIRSCLMLADSRKEVKILWSYLNNMLCN